MSEWSPCFGAPCGRLPVRSRCARLTQREMTSYSARLLTRGQWASSSRRSSRQRRATVVSPRSVNRQHPDSITVSTVRQTVGVSRLRIRVRLLQHTHTHTHTHLFNGHLSGLPWRAGTRKVNQSGIFAEARDSEWQWHQLGHMQVCTSLQTNNHASNPPLSFLQAGCHS